MKKITILFVSLIIFTCLTIFSNAVQAKEIRFVQVTDTHFSPENPYSKKVLQSAVEDINNLNDVSFVVFTGDNIDKQNPDYLKDFVKIVNKLKPRYYLVIGNHDVFRNNGLSKKQYLDTVRNYNFFYPINARKPNYVFKKNGYVFIVVDGAKEIIPNNNGYYRKDTLAWLDRKLTKYNKYPVVILQHFPIVPPKDIKSHRTYQAEEYLAMLGKHHNVIAVIAGHYHINGEIMQDGVYHITSPTLLNNPHQYKIIDISTVKGFSSMIYTQLKEVEVNSEL